MRQPVAKREIGLSQDGWVATNQPTIRKYKGKPASENSHSHSLDVVRSIFTHLRIARISTNHKMLVFLLAICFASTGKYKNMFKSIAHIIGDNVHHLPLILFF